LWRCHLWSVRTTSPWEEVRDFAHRAFPKPSVAFADEHLVMALAAGSDHDGAAARIAELRRMDGEGRQSAGRVAADVAEGMAAFACGDWERTIALMAPVLEELVRVGGSRAQRDVFEQTLLGAYLRAGWDAEASRLLRRAPRARRPAPPPAREPRAPRAPQVGRGGGAAGGGERPGGGAPPRLVRRPGGGKPGERVTQRPRPLPPAEGPRPASRSASTP